MKKLIVIAIVMILSGVAVSEVLAGLVLPKPFIKISDACRPGQGGSGQVGDTYYRCLNH